MTVISNTLGDFLNNPSIRLAGTVSFSGRFPAGLYKVVLTDTPKIEAYTNGNHGVVFPIEVVEVIEGPDSALGRTYTDVVYFTGGIMNVENPQYTIKKQAVISRCAVLDGVPPGTEYEFKREGTRLDDDPKREKLLEAYSLDHYANAVEQEYVIKVVHKTGRISEEEKAQGQEAPVYVNIYWQAAVNSGISTSGDDDENPFSTDDVIDL